MASVAVEQLIAVRRPDELGSSAIGNLRAVAGPGKPVRADAIDLALEQLIQPIWARTGVGRVFIPIEIK